MYVCMHVCMHACMCVYVCMHACMYEYVCMYMYVCIQHDACMHYASTPVNTTYTCRHVFTKVECVQFVPTDGRAVAEPRVTWQCKVLAPSRGRWRERAASVWRPTLSPSAIWRSKLSWTKSEWYGTIPTSNIGTNIARPAGPFPIAY